LKFLKISGHNRTIINNFIALGILQGTNFILPLVTIPYLVRVLGPDKFGLVAFAQAFHAYFILLTDYGFNLSATRDVSIHRNHLGKLSEIFSTVLICKLLLCLLSLVIMIIIVENVGEFSQDKPLMYLSFSLVIGQVILPVWFFQGMERMKFLTYLSITGKALSVILVFLLTTSRSDYVIVPLLLSSANILAGIIGIVIVKTQFRVTFAFPRVSQIKDQFREGWHTFVSSFSIGIYVSVNLFILAFFASDESVGHYSIAEKIVIAMWQVPGVFSQAIYPFVCSMTTSGFEKIMNLFKRLYIPFCFLILVACTILYFFPGPIIQLVAGKPYPEAVSLLRILSFVPFIIALNVPAYQILMAYNFKSSHTLVFTTATVVNIILNLILASKFSSYGTAFSVVITQLLTTIGLYFILEFRHRDYALLSYLYKELKRVF
jgi:PST family polysaccharide transporter